MLDAAASAHPNSWFRVKADSVDIVAGLGESLRLQWSGVVDLNVGELSKLPTVSESSCICWSPYFNFKLSAG